MSFLTTLALIGEIALSSLLVDLLYIFSTVMSIVSASGTFVKSEMTSKLKTV